MGQLSSKYICGICSNVDSFSIKESDTKTGMNTHTHTHDIVVEMQRKEYVPADGSR